MKKENEFTKRCRGGRKLKDDPAKFRYMVNLNREENEIFRSMLSDMGVTNISKFINQIIFGKEIKVVKIDKAAMDYYMRLTNFYHQFQAIGNNYNQTVREIYRTFSEKRAVQLLSKLERVTLQLVIVSKEIIKLTDEFESKYLPKNVD